MSGKAKLLAKLLAKPTPKDFTKQQLDSLMSIFDEPHPGNNLYSYQIEKVIEFLKCIGQID